MQRSNLVCLALLLSLAASVRAATIESDAMSVRLDDNFPRVIQYRWKANGAVLEASERAPASVLLNGIDCKPRVASRSPGRYDLAFSEQGVHLAVEIKVSGSVLTWAVTDIREAGPLCLRTIEIPGLAMLSGAAADDVALGNFPGAYYASEKPEDRDRFGKVADLQIPFDTAKNGKPRNCDAAGHQGVSYAFLTSGRIAAGMWSNVLEEELRMIVTAKGEQAGRRLAIAPGKWTWREIPTETLPLPQAKVFLAADENGDGKVDWQDAAIVYRKNTPVPYAGEKTKDHPIAYIAMNFASQATNPFLRVLDNAKKIWLYTDGLGQRIQYKGFQSEGHDSSHPDYAGNVGRRQGGREELNFAMRRGHDFNVLSGIHINAHEYHKEAKWFSPEIADMKRIGWSWLDESYCTDYRYDSAYGTLYQRLDAMRADLPWLDFVYLDVYFGKGWPGWRMHSKINDLGIAQFTEFPGIMERAVVWIHTANDWTQALWGKGDRSAIARFIYYSVKDTFQHDPLLRGTNCDGFEGWHAERDMLQTVKSAFTVNLPTAYLQHFDLLQEEPLSAQFSGGVRSEVVGDTAKIYGRDGQLINSCRYSKLASRKDELVSDVKFAGRPTENLCFIPWDPIAETKIYHWNDKGGRSTWTLPKSWKGTTSVKLYRLTDLGRVFEREIAVSPRENRVTLTDIAAATPYAIYRETPPALPNMRWGEGGLVRDPGFDSHSFRFWKKADDASHVTIENDKTGQTELVVRSSAAGEVRQEVAGLVPGQTYAASVWTSIDGKRTTSLAVEPAAAGAPPFVDPKGPKTPIAAPVDAAPFTGVANTIDSTRFINYTDASSKYLRNWHRLKVHFTAPAAGKVDVVLRAAAGSDATVKFDDVRVVKSAISRPPADAKNVVLFEDFENVDEGWGPFMYGWQGPMNTHLSEANPPYTDDTIGGKYSLKSRREGSPGLLYRTVPATLKFKPGTSYRISLDYLCDTKDCFALVAGPDSDSGEKTAQRRPMPDGSWKVQHFVATITTDARDNWFIGVAKLDAKKAGTVVIDNFLIEEVDGR
jgi:endo-alpha-N-acetylgalactosaminidase